MIWCSTAMEEHIRNKTFDLCAEVDRLTENAFTLTGEPIIPIRFMTESYSNTLQKFSFGYPEELKLMLGKYRYVFKRTIKKCWPGRSLFQFSVVATIEAAIVEAQALAVLSFYGGYRAIGWVFSKIAAKSKKAATAISTVLIGWFAYEIYQENESNIKMTDSLFKSSEEDRTNIQVGEKVLENLPKLLQKNQEAFEKLMENELAPRILRLEQALVACQENCQKIRLTLEKMKSLQY